MSRPIAQSGSRGIAHPWPEPPKAGAIITVARGIKWLRMPLPFRLDHINLYLLEDGDAWTVVDAGIGLERTRELWQGAFDAELDGKPIRRVLVTHFHPDHMGNARWLTERWGIDLWCTQAEWLMAQVAWQLGDDVGGRLDYYRQNGVGGREMSLIRERVGHYRQVVPAVPSRFRAVRDGDVMTVGERRWHVLAVYGHSPEQAIIHAPESRVLISGDQVLPKITTNVGVWPDQPLGNPLRLYLESLERFPGMAEDTLVLPAHGLPFHGLHARIERLRSHHDERLARALDATREPATAADVLPALFSRDLDGQQFGFAFGETLAHLHYLEWEDRVERLVDGGGLYRFRAR